MASASPPDVGAVAARVLEVAGRRAPTLGAGRLVCVDGPGGSGKTTLAAAVAALSPGARVVHMDDLYDGWSGLASVGEPLSTLLRPLAQGRAGRYRRYDWHAAALAEEVVVEPAPLLVVEGVGSGSSVVADLVTVLVWVWAPPVLRLRRGLARDGVALRAEWEAWMASEDTHFAGDRTAERADVLVDGTGERAADVVLE